MSSPDSRPPPGLLARALKKVGHLTSPETRSGKVFAKAEQGLTRVAARLAQSPTFLRVSGGLMRRGFTLQIRRTSVMEKTLHSLRVPTASEVETLRDQLRRMNDQVEALGSQLEHVVELLERQEQQPAEPAADAPPAPHRRRSGSASRSVP
jgi:TolA-binding protein